MDNNTLDRGQTFPTTGADPLEKIWFFGVKSWFFTRNTPNIFAPAFARRNFFTCAPLTWNSGTAPVPCSLFELLLAAINACFIIHCVPHFTYMVIFYSLYTWVVYWDSSVSICGESCGGSDHSAWPEVTSPEVTWLFPLLFPRIFPYFFPSFFSRTFFPGLFFSHTFYFLFWVLFPVLFFRFFLFYPYFFFVLFPVLFYRTFSNVATFEIQRFDISVSCFSSTCRYNTVHVHCIISIQTSPVGLPLEGWGARKGPKMNLFDTKVDWNVL